MQPAIAVVDYGMGNLRSVAKALELTGCRVTVTDRPGDLADAAGVVVPGVGAFAEAMRRLTAGGMAAAVADEAAGGKPLLGVCLGLQILFEYGEEGEGAAGLGLLPGRVVRFPAAPGLKVPHMGWNTVEWEGEAPLFAGLTPPVYYYFVHSYCVPAADVPAAKAGVARCLYGDVAFVAAAWQGNVMGTQFHPEKSGRAGLAILRNFAAICAGDSVPPAGRQRVPPGRRVAGGRRGAGRAEGERLMLVIPAIDLRGGRCVRLTQGRYDAETVYADDPVAVARDWVAQGAERLHVVDLDGAREGRPVNLGVVRAIANAVEVPVQLGGGLRSAADITQALDAGADRVILGTRALQDEGFLKQAAALFPGRIIVSVDVRGERVAVAGWLEEAPLTVDEAAGRLAGLGFGEVIVTDVERDGTLAGINPDLVRRVARHGLRVIAAGGVGSLDDIVILRALAPEGLAGVIVGKALYAGRLNLADALAAARA